MATDDGQADTPKDGWLSLLTAPPMGHVELRAIGVDGDHVESKFFDPSYPTELKMMAREGRKLARRSTGVYFTLNPVDATAPFRKAKRAAADKDILERRWMLVDVDPTRPAGLSSTDGEKAAGRLLVGAVRDFLHTQGWPSPILADSGNGWHLLYRVDLPNDDESRDLVRDAVRALATRFDSPGAKVDRSTFNASRICKLYGTVARKGEPTPERPHRVSRILEVPEPLQVVMPEMLRALAGEDAPATLPMPVKSTSTSPAEGKAKKRGIVAKAVDASDPLDRARAFLDECDPAVSGQRGHGQTLKVAIKIGPGFDLAPDDAFRLLWEGYNPRCVPPWDERDLRRKVDEAYKKESRRGWLKDAEKGSMKSAVGRKEGPPPQKSEPEGEGDPRPERIFANFEEDDVDGKPRRFPLRIEQLAETLAAIVGPWPKRVGETLFREGADHKPVFLGSATRLFAWIETHGRLDWAKGNRFVTQERFYEHLRMTAEAFDAIETLPHWPHLPKVYYMHQELPKPSGKLEGLLAYFSPLTPEDRELIKAMLLTVFWGGEPGGRPSFLITGPDNDPGQGRGLGKTTLVDILACDLLGGYVDVSPTDAIADVKTRLLSPGAQQTRLARLDNVKTLKFSWADLEGLITATEISGRMLYVGEGKRPNTIIWCVTLNGASLSKDLAERVIPIKLARPTYRATWDTEIRAYARKHRWEILADLGSILECPPGPLACKGRWAPWERCVLSKTDLAESCQAVVSERQGAVDDDNEERDIVAEKFREEIAAMNRDPDSSHVFIRSGVAADWLMAATRKSWPTNQATAHIKTLGIPELRHGRSNGSPGWRWKGLRSNPNARAESLALRAGSGASDREEDLPAF